MSKRNMLSRKGLNKAKHEMIKHVTREFFKCEVEKKKYGEHYIGNNFFEVKVYGREGNETRLKDEEKNINQFSFDKDATTRIIKYRNLCMEKSVVPYMAMISFWNNNVIEFAMASVDDNIKANKSDGVEGEINIKLYGEYLDKLKKTKSIIYRKFHYRGDLIEEIDNKKFNIENVKLMVDELELNKERLKDKKEIEEINEIITKLTSIGISSTEKEMITKGRIGHGRFKDKLIKKECKCNSDEERLDVYNGFLYCPNHDSLYDKGYITFDDKGCIIISKYANLKTLEDMRINKDMRIKIEEEHKVYLEYHRKNVLKK